MSRKRLPVWRTLLIMATDLVAIAGGMYFAYIIRFHSAFTEWVPIRVGYNPAIYLGLFPLACLVWLFALRLDNLYRRRSKVLDVGVVRKVLTGSCLAMLMLIAWTYVRRSSNDFSRIYTVIMPMIVILAILVSRTILHCVFQWMMLNRGIGQCRALVLGIGPIAEQIIRILQMHPERGILPVGIILGKANEDAPDKILGLPVLGGADNLEEIIREHRIGEVIVAETDLEKPYLIDLLIQCDRAMAVFKIVPETTELVVFGMTVETIDGVPLLGLRETPLQGWNAALKRLLDICVASFVLFLSTPVMILLSVLIFLKDRMDPFFIQERMGIDGRMFDILKFRTMPPGAEERSGPVFATDIDPRCTRLGAFLRRTHLDEIPQLVNVLKGDMSLIGPRPERPYFIEKFRNDVPRYMARHHVRSGITGWAQINGLCGLHGSIDERLKYDLYYIENWSLWLDFKILFLTIFGQLKPGHLENS
jgi:exopolysaccharide biosynthesis polyprenyl glycosylphosphotransferase